MYLAHSKNDNGKGKEEFLRDHLQAVAHRAKFFAEPFGAEQQAYLAGLLHDLGKYSEQFQRRLEDPKRIPSRDHWSAGAAFLALLFWKKPKYSLLPTVAILGHHCGLPKTGSLREKDTEVKAYAESLHNLIRDDSKHKIYTESDLQLLTKRFVEDGFVLPTIKSGVRWTPYVAANMLDIRMLFSTLVDADFLETEAHFQGNAEIPRIPRPEGPTLDIDLAIDAFNAHLAAIREESDSPAMDALRNKLMQGCIESADMPQGAFTLTAPTGSGKTLAMLGFALHHAKKHRLRRIVLAMPFLNIIDQTAKIYESIFSEKNGFHPETVLQHHSMTKWQGDLESNGEEERPHESDAERNRKRMLTENWDAPIILTTNVQLLESLMAHRPSRCRKLHRLAQSIILFDESQTLPIHLAKATLATLSRLADPEGPYRASVVFATATQPAFDTLDNDSFRKLARSGWRPSEIVAEENSKPFYEFAASRHRVNWRHTTPIAWDELAAELIGHRQIMCIVNLKRHAIRLAGMLREGGVQEGLLHLSTNMCPAHRGKVLDEIRTRLRENQPIHLAATQCVEAGVDLDFPVVYRAFAPLDALAQAAGRCNRHGKHKTPGKVVVFCPESDGKIMYPPGYEEALGATESYLNKLAEKKELDTFEILNDPTNLRNYYQEYYWLTGRSLENREASHEKERLLHKALEASNFPDVAKLYRLIEDNTIQVLVPYDRPAFERLCDDLEEGGAWDHRRIGRWLREASPYAVSLYRPKLNDPLWHFLDPVRFGKGEDFETEWFVALPKLEYDSLTGICQEKSGDAWIM